MAEASSGAAVALQRAGCTFQEQQCSLVSPATAAINCHLVFQIATITLTSPPKLLPRIAEYAPCSTPETTAFQSERRIEALAVTQVSQITFYLSSYVPLFL